MKEFGVYTAMRLGLFVAAFAVVFGLWALIFDEAGILGPLVIAAVISSVASVYLLKGPRARFAERIEGRAARVSETFENMRSKEDD